MGDSISNADRFFIGDEDSTYNCLGFALGRRYDFGLPPEYVYDVVALLKNLGCDRRPKLAPTEKGLALFNPHDPSKWHVAKHLLGDWYESKDCHRKRFVHRLDALRAKYGGVDSFWVVLESEEARKARREFIYKTYEIQLDNLCPIQDSKDELKTILPTHLLDTLDVAD